MPHLIDVFKTLPRELFRVNNGYAIKLRPWAQHKTQFDVHLVNGFVKAKAHDPKTYRGKSSDICFDGLQ